MQLLSYEVFLSAVYIWLIYQQDVMHGLRGREKHCDIVHMPTNTHSTLPGGTVVLVMTERKKTGSIPDRGILSPLSIEPSPWISLMYGLPQL